jgi:hypothetical protein
MRVASVDLLYAWAHFQPEVGADHMLEPITPILLFAIRTADVKAMQELYAPIVEGRKQLHAVDLALVNSYMRIHGSLCDSFPEVAGGSARR